MRIDRNKLAAALEERERISREAKPMVKDDSLYFGDNGAVYCGLHLGMTARFTGRDLSGQKIERITPRVAMECTAMQFSPICESCGMKPSGERPAPKEVDYCIKIEGVQ